MASRLRQQTIQVLARVPGQDRVLTPDALAFLARLHERFESRRQDLLGARRRHDEAVLAGQRLGFRPDTMDIREWPWQVAPIPEALRDRRIEITGPPDRKMMINALNSGAQVYMLDFEDSHSPVWAKTVAGQANLQDAVAGRLTHTDAASGRHYAVGSEPALLMVRVRGLHLDEVHVRVGGRPVSAALFDFAMAFHHNASAQVQAGTGPFYYIPKLEHAEEAGWWADVFDAAEEEFGFPQGTVRATVLIETLPAAFEMEEILYALRHHVAALNAGRWDYIFSCIKTFREDPGRVLPDRSQLTMDAPFMRAYADLLVQTCHRRGAMAIGGMSACIPDRDPAAHAAALAQVRRDKDREARQGFDGTWVAHPGLVAAARAPFDRVFGERRNQLDELREDVYVGPRRLVDFEVPGGHVTLEGLRTNVEVGIRYLDAWLAGRGAIAINGLMEDVATAEISRAQVWQWVRHGVLVGGMRLTHHRVRRMAETVTSLLLDASDDPMRTRLAADLFCRVALGERFEPFLTVPASADLEVAP